MTSAVRSIDPSCPRFGHPVLANLAIRAQLSSLLLALAVLIPAPVAAQQNLYEVQLRSGTVLRCEIEDLEFRWNDVATDGAVTSSRRKLSEVESLEFASETVTEQVANVKTLCDQLADRDFHRRRQAEEQLISEAGPFIEILQKQLADARVDSESRFRLARVLEKLDDRQARPQAAYDVLVTGAGTTRGDAPKFQLELTAHGQSLTLRREHLVRLVKSSAAAEVPTVGLGYQALDAPGERFFQPHQRQVDFDKGKNGSVLESDARLEQLFAFNGALFQCEGEGNQVFTSDYTLESRSRGQSGVTFDKAYDTDGLTPRFKGVLRISFCNPGQPTTPATTQAVGAFLQVIRPARTIVLEAYNLDDECVGVCEAFNSTSFTGIAADQPIAYARVLTNKTLVAKDVDLDNDFATDDLSYDPLQIQPLLPRPNRHVVATRNGDVIACSALEIQTEQVVLNGIEGLGDEQDLTLTVSRKNIASITFAADTRKPRDLTSAGFARLSDGSVIAIGQLSNAGAIDFPQLAWVDQMACCWGRENSCRYPTAEDLQQELPVAVFPTYRSWLNNLQLDATQIAWNAQGSAIQKQFETEVEGISDPDWGSQFDLRQAPCIWFPKTLASDSQPASVGMLRLTDGQRFCLGGQAGFRLTALTNDDIELSNGSEKILLPLSQVKSIVLPD